MGCESEGEGEGEGGWMRVRVRVLLLPSPSPALTLTYAAQKGFHDKDRLVIRAVILFRDVEHCGIDSAPGINSTDSGGWVGEGEGDNSPFAFTLTTLTHTHPNLIHFTKVYKPI
jgi:hypothetical protein